MRATPLLSHLLRLTEEEAASVHREPALCCLLAGMIHAALVGELPPDVREASREELASLRRLLEENGMADTAVRDALTAAVSGERRGDQYRYRCLAVRLEELSGTVDAPTALTEILARKSIAMKEALGGCTPPSAPAPRPTAPERPSAVTVSEDLRTRVRDCAKRMYDGDYTPTPRELSVELGIRHEEAVAAYPEPIDWEKTVRARLGRVTCRGEDGGEYTLEAFCGNEYCLLARKVAGTYRLEERFLCFEHLKNCLGVDRAVYFFRPAPWEDLFRHVWVKWELNVFFEDATKIGAMLARLGYPVTLCYDEHDRYWYL